MRAAVYHGPGDIRVETVPDPRIREPTDAMARIVRAAICGSDLWAYRGVAKRAPGRRAGHEWMGVVEEVGPEVVLVRRGDVVVSPFMFSDGTCEYCVAKLHSACVNGAAWGADGSDGGQAEAIRIPHADGTLVPVPDRVLDNEHLVSSVLLLADVMSTGYHAAMSASVQAGKTVVVIGDGAVGLCAVQAARLLRAERVIVFGHHWNRLRLALDFGATEVVDADIAALQSLAGGGAHAVLECVGTPHAVNTAIAVARPGGTIACVGVPHEPGVIDRGRLFAKNIALRGGAAPARAYIPRLLEEVLRDRLQPGPVLDLTLPLEAVAAGYRAMDQRDAIKVMLRP